MRPLLIKHTLVFAFLLIFCTAASAGTLQWGPVTASDNNGGAFLVGSTIVTSGLSFTMFLPNFLQSDFASFSGEVDLAVTATYDQPWINGMFYKFDGVIDQTNGLASVAYVQTASGTSASPASGNFTVPPFAGTFGQDVQGNSTINLTTQINLNDNGGLASITSIHFDIIAPEPATAGVMVLGVALLGLVGRRRLVR